MKDTFEEYKECSCTSYSRHLRKCNKRYQPSNTVPTSFWVYLLLMAVSDIAVLVFLVFLLRGQGLAFAMAYIVWLTARSVVFHLVQERKRRSQKDR